MQIAWAANERVLPPFSRHREPLSSGPATAAAGSLYCAFPSGFRPRRSATAILMALSPDGHRGFRGTWDVDRGQVELGGDDLRFFGRKGGHRREVAAVDHRLQRRVHGLPELRIDPGGRERDA